MFSHIRLHLVKALNRIFSKFVFSNIEKGEVKELYDPLVQSMAIAKVDQIKIQNLLEKAKDEYNEIISDFENTLNKSEGDTNRLIVQNRIDSFTKDSLTEIRDLVESLEKSTNHYNDISKSATQEQIEKVGDLIKSCNEDEIKEIEKSIKEKTILAASEKKKQKKSSVDNYAVAVIRKPGSYNDILFLKRSPEAKMEPNKWSLPGGHIDEGEYPHQAVKREVYEETNLKVTHCNVIEVVDISEGRKIYYFDCDVDFSSSNEALLDGENTQYCYMNYEKWSKEDLLFDLKDHLEYFENKYKYLAES